MLLNLSKLIKFQPKWIADLGHLETVKILMIFFEIDKAT